MGMFDSVNIACKKCNKLVEFQSKSGPCLLKTYYYPCEEPGDIPAEVLRDINGDCEICDCGNEVTADIAEYDLHPEPEKTEELLFKHLAKAVSLLSKALDDPDEFANKRDEAENLIKKFPQISERLISY